jgi:hypothetical protein
VNRGVFENQIRACRRTASQRRTLQLAAELHRYASQGVTGTALMAHVAPELHLPKGIG